MPKIKAMGHELHLEYEGLHLICFSCGCYGHRMDQCCDAVPSSQLVLEAMHVVPMAEEKLVAVGENSVEGNLEVQNKKEEI